MEPTAVTRDLINHAYGLKPPRSPGGGVQRASRGRWGGLGRAAQADREGTRLCSVSPYPLHLGHLAVPGLRSFMINQESIKLNVSLSSVSHFSKLIKPRERS